MNQIVVDVGIDETQLALLENNELVELYVERKNNKRIVGNIYKGRVTNVLPGMEAAFVDIGLEKNSFLYVRDAIPQELLEEEPEAYKNISIKDMVKSGQEVIVQVIKEPIGSKGARVTTNITLPGRYLVLMPNTDYVGISRRIGNMEERNRLKKEIEEIKPSKMGIIVRTAAQGKTKEQFKEDIKFLLKLWYKIEKEKKLGFAPRTIYRDFDLVNRTIRDTFTQEIQQFIINDKEEYKNVLELVELISPHLKDRVQLFQDDIHIFQAYNIEAQLAKSIGRKIWLKSGGYIVIDTTEALTVIDVNTGKYVGSIDLDDTILKTNLEAAKEIAKQLRLRDIGGIIIVDFIDMTKEEDESQVLQSLQGFLAKDRTKTRILGITQLGLVEITRKKVRQRLESLLHKKCPCCDGTGRVLSEYTILQRLEKEVKRIAIHTNAQAVIVEVHPTVEEVIKEEESFLHRLEEVTGVKVFAIGNAELHFNDLKTSSMGKLEVIEQKLAREDK